MLPISHPVLLLTSAAVLRDKVQERHLASAVDDVGVVCQVADSGDNGRVGHSCHPLWDWSGDGGLGGGGDGAAHQRVRVLLRIDPLDEQPGDHEERRDEEQGVGGVVAQQALEDGTEGEGLDEHGDDDHHVDDAHVDAPALLADHLGGHNVGYAHD